MNYTYKKNRWQVNILYKSTPVSDTTTSDKKFISGLHAGFPASSMWLRSHAKYSHAQFLSRLPYTGAATGYTSMVS